ncbi:hypothetical protein J3E68DRAFT_437250 [Trichoderma sp. SZMC 28012]
MNRYKTSLKRYSIFNQPTYSATVSPGTEGDISKVINLAKSYSFPFLTRAGDHGGANMSDFENGVSLDLSKFNSIVIDSAAQTMTVGPGVHYRDIFGPLYNARFYIVKTGSCSCPSVIGVAIGGGVGRLIGQLGLTTDALQSVRLIGADGIVKTVSATSYPDLWWAIRGAGANYGVITSATFKIQPLFNNNGGNAFMLDFVLPAEEDFNPMPVNLAGIIVFNWNSTHNLSQVVSDWIFFFGTEADARKTLAPILALNATFITATLPWNQIISVSGGGSDALNCVPNKLRNTFNLNLKTYSAADFLQKYPGGRGSQVILELFANNATAAVPSSETSWPWRDVRGFFQELFVYDTGDSVTAQGAATYGSQLRSQFAPYSGYSTPTVFVNYARGDEKIEDIYGADKLPRLAQLKQKYDPNNLFAYGHPIPLSYP